jgi:hypothetical protein
MPDESGLMPEEFIDRPEPSPEQLKVKDLELEHGDRFIGVRDVAVDHERRCWALRDAPVFEADLRDVAPIAIRRTPDGGYEVHMGGLPDASNFALVPTPDIATWVSVQVAEGPGLEEDRLNPA